MPKFFIRPEKVVAKTLCDMPIKLKPVFSEISETAVTEVPATVMEAAAVDFMI
ncbi:MAG: hypothetical protein ACD_47C00086G0001 [uncultured bacterium]|nr:MAG: hypothetical protein ACD_47C00086G0001 [uncultured bacterium]